MKLIFLFSKTNFFSSPGLEIEGIGMIRLPLSDLDKHQLKLKCDKSSELESSKFTLNPSFEKVTIKAIELKLKQMFGIAASIDISVKLKSLILEESEGSVLKKVSKNQSEKCVSNLFVLLPSIYEGGEIRVYHNKGMKSLNISKQNK